MPSLAFLLAMAFNLDPALTAGVVLVGTCPGGTSSNVITFMSKGDLVLSVTMTSVSTLLSPILTPLITYQLIGQKIAFDPLGMFWSIIQIVIIPICLGLAVKSLLPKLAEQATNYLPAVSAIAISLIIAGVITVSRDNILKTSGVILLVVICHNCLGYLLGFILARLTGMS
ncbi:MAG: bile acid:sodium symporter family protein [Acidaminococcaceae bacterium]|nr:bile acid:sodium symporter family protein [Acidaminococcaceae bacterium]